MIFFIRKILKDRDISRYYAHKFLYHVILITITLLAIIIGLNSDILTNYKNRNDLKIFYNDQILKYDSIKTNYPTNGSIRRGKEVYYYLFIIDRTLSTKEYGDVKGDKIIKSLKRTIFNKLFDKYKIQNINSSIEKENFIDSLDLKQLIPLQIINNLKENFNAYKYIKIGLAYYDGDTNYIQPINVKSNASMKPYWVDINNESDLSKYFEDISDTLLYSTFKITKHQRTDFKRLCEEINSKYLSTLNDTSARIILNFFSDFLHEDKLAESTANNKKQKKLFKDNQEIPFNEVEESIREISQNKILYQINFFKLPTSLISVANPKENIEKLLNLFNYYFKHFYTYEITVDPKVINRIKNIDEINYLSVPVYSYLNDSLQKSIIFYYPWPKHKYSYASVCNICFKDIKPSNYIITLKADEINQIESRLYYKIIDINKKDLLDASNYTRFLTQNRIQKVKLTKDSCLTLNFTNGYHIGRSVDLSLEVFQLGSAFKYQYPLLNIQKFSQNNIYLFRFLIILLTTSLLLLLFSFSLIDYSFQLINKYLIIQHITIIIFINIIVLILSLTFSIYWIYLILPIFSVSVISFLLYKIFHFQITYFHSFISFILIISTLISLFTPYFKFIDFIILPFLFVFMIFWLLYFDEPISRGLI